MVKKLKNNNILILTVKWGHYSIAKAVENAVIEKEMRVEVVKINVESLSDFSYTAFYRLFPSLWKIPFKISEINQAKKLAEKYLERAYIKTLERIIADHKPDIVISTYFAFNNPLEKLSLHYNFKLVNIVANPRTFSRIELTEKSANFLFDNKAYIRCQKMRIPKENCVVGGWLTRNEFTENYDKEKVRINLNLPKDIFNICIVGGSDGSYGILNTLPAFIGITQNVQIFFICGNNKQLCKTINGFAKIVQLSGNENVRVKVLGFTEKVYQYIQSADIVMGKAGPNLLFETIAAKTPSFALSHIAVQEDGNLDTIREYRLGFVAENALKAINKVRKIIKNPKILRRFDKPLEKMACYNSRSSEVLNKIIKEKLQ